jgi:hypothetical protein
MKSGLSMIATVSCLTILSVSVMAQGNNSHVSALPPQSSPHGKTYAEWSVQWWQWFLSIPAATSPGAGGPCETGQSGKVWFLAGLFSPSPLPVQCTVPPGTTLFFPIVNVECSNAEPPPFHGDTPAERQSCATGFLNSIENDLELTLTVDGRTLQKPKEYRAASGDFAFQAPEGAIFGISPGSWRAAGDGYYVMLPPLPPGPHIIRLTTSIGGDMIIDTTFSLLVSR